MTVWNFKMLYLMELNRKVDKDIEITDTGQSISLLTTQHGGLVPYSRAHAQEGNMRTRDASQDDENPNHVVTKR